MRESERGQSGYDHIQHWFDQAMLATLPAVSSYKAPVPPTGPPVPRATLLHQVPPRRRQVLSRSHTVSVIGTWRGTGKGAGCRIEGGSDLEASSML